MSLMRVDNLVIINEQGSLFEVMNHKELYVSGKRHQGILAYTNQRGLYTPATLEILGVPMIANRPQIVRVFGMVDTYCRLTFDLYLDNVLYSTKQLYVCAGYYSSGDDASFSYTYTVAAGGSSPTLDVTLLPITGFPGYVKDFKFYNGPILSLDRTGFIDTLPVTYTGVQRYSGNKTASGKALGMPEFYIRRPTDSDGTSAFNEFVSVHKTTRWQRVGLQLNTILSLVSDTTANRDIKLVVTGEISSGSLQDVNFPELAMFVE